MPRLAYFLILTLPMINGLSAETNRWKNLIHANDSGYGQAINSDHFFIGSQHYADAEYYDFIDIIRSPIQGRELACSYPARYSIIRQRENLPSYDLRKCKKLNTFLTNLNQKHISLALSSEYFNSPSSIFGHLMLIFHDAPDPELDAATINFSAILDKKDGFFKHIFKGLRGKYPGEFVLTPFYKKLHEYSKVEQRYIHIYNLSLSKQQIRLIIYHLFELRGVQFPYYFLKENCAYQIEKLLDVATGIPNTPHWLYTLPVDVVRKYEGFITSKIVIPPTISKIKNILATLLPKEKDLFKSYIKKDFSKESLAIAGSNKLKEAIYNYYDYLFRTKRSAPANYKKISTLNFQSSDSPPSKTLDPLHRPYSSKIEIQTNNNKGFQATFRPVFTSFDDFQLNGMHESELSLLETSLSVEKNKWQLERFNLVQIGLYTDFEPINPKLSWKFNLNANRDNRSEDLFAELLIGLGHTYSLLAHFKINWMGSFGLDSNIHQTSPFFTPEISIFGYIFNRIKVRYGISYKLSSIGNFLKHTGSLSYIFSPAVSVSSKWKKKSVPDDEEFSIGISYYY